MGGLSYISYAFLAWLPSFCLRHRDDAPSPLLLGILATRDPKEDEEEEKWEESKE